MNPPDTAAPARPRRVGPAPMPAAFDPADVAQARWLTGRRAVLVFGLAAAAAFGLLALPWMESTPSPPPQDVAAAHRSVKIHINATPWAEISLDGVALGVTPLGNVDAELGPHRLEAEMPDGRILEREIVVTEEQRHFVVGP